MLTLLVISDIVFVLVVLRLRSRLAYVELRTDLVVRGGPSAERLERLEMRVDALERRGGYAPEVIARATEPTTTAQEPTAPKQQPVAPEAQHRPLPAVQRAAESEAAEFVLSATALPPTVATTPAPTPAPVVPSQPERPRPAAPEQEPVTAPLFAQAREAKASAAAPTLRERLRASMGNDEWETLVGGSVVNKIGAIVLVIGIALFLGYSFEHVGPTGRALIAVAVSVSLLAAGVFSEGRPRFRTFSRGLIGAGWAAMYATAYAIYAVPEARIINDAFAGSLVLLAVACGMIGHSLKYRVQAVTAVAYFAAFAALAITPATPFAVISLLPLAASVLYLAWRLNWYPMALFGAVATYATCISKSDPNATLAGSQALLCAYWLMFELFDLLRMSRRVANRGAEWIAPINAAGFLGISYLVWLSHAPEHLWLAAAYGASMYLASAIARGMLRPISSFAKGEDLVARLRQGSFEGATLIAVGLAALAILGRAPGVWSSFGLALEAEALYIAGVALGSNFIRRFGEWAFVVSLVRLAGTATLSSQTTVLGGQLWSWSPGALFHAFLFYVNRGLRRPGVMFSTAAAILVTLVLVAELPLAYAGLGWVVFGVVLLEWGLAQRLIEFRVQGGVLVGAGTLLTASVAVYVGNQPWQPLAACLAIVYAFALQIRFGLPRVEDEEESNVFQIGGACGTTLMAALLLWRIVPPAYLGIAGCLLALVLLELGFRRLPSALRGALLPVTIVTLCVILATHVTDLDRTAPGGAWPTYLIAAICGSVASFRLRYRREEISERETMTGNLVSALAAMAFTTVLWLVVPNAVLSLAFLATAALILELAIRASFPFLKRVALGEAAAALIHVCFVDLFSERVVAGMSERLLVVAAAIAGMYWLRRRFSRAGDIAIGNMLFWASFVPLLLLPYAQFGELAAPWWAGTAVGLLAFGVYRGDRAARSQSYILSFLAVSNALWFDVSPAHLTVSVPVVVLLYTAHFLSKRAAEPRVPESLSLAATLLLCAVLYGEVSGGMLTVAWGVAGLVLLSSGFPLRNRVFRLQGMALLLICTLKLFLYDLRNLETPYRILSFIGLGLILLSVSWIYTRFRDRVRRIL